MYTPWWFIYVILFIYSVKRPTAVLYLQKWVDMYGWHGVYVCVVLGESLCMCVCISWWMCASCVSLTLLSVWVNACLLTQPQISKGWKLQGGNASEACDNQLTVQSPKTLNNYTRPAVHNASYSWNKIHCYRGFTIVLRLELTAGPISKTTLWKVQRKAVLL